MSWNFRTLFGAPVLALAIAPALALEPATETGACSLEDAAPATAAASDQGDILLDDGRRAALTGLEIPGDPTLADAAADALDALVSGRQVFALPLAPAPDRWGRAPVAIFVAADERPESPLILLGARLLEAGLARFRPDKAAEPCARAYLAAESAARAQGRGLWRRPEFTAIDARAPTERFARARGMVAVEGTPVSIGETTTLFYLNFAEKRREGFAAVISRRDLDIIAASGIQQRSLVGRRLRLRGLIDTTFGPRMDIVSPSAIELLDDAPAPRGR